MRRKCGGGMKSIIQEEEGLLNWSGYLEWLE